MRKPTSSLPLAALFGLALTAASASAAITYVDAQEGATGNTYATTGSLGDTSWTSLENSNPSRSSSFQ